MTPEDAIRRYLEADEKLVWTGRRTDRFLPAMFVGSTALTLIALIAANKFAEGVFRFSSTLSGKGLVADALALIGCIAAAGFFAVRRPWQLYRQTKTFYAITSKRLLILERSWPTEIRSYYAEDIGDIVYNVAANGIGYVVFKRVSASCPTKPGTSPGASPPARFLGPNCWAARSS
ncbi:MAG: hypothetical protein FJX35_12140 [Alphaproteobacteria bacterium]|nr:hypothetical protein [Alphaproteobacteria bacterium]